MRRFLLIFAILFIAPIVGRAATCTSTETVTKCAKIPTEIYVEYESAISAPCTFIYKDVVYSGNKPIPGYKTTCAINNPLNANVDGYSEPGVYGDTLFVWSSFSFISKLDGDICPDGFYTVPYNVSCGTGMVDTANVPNCDDDTTGESCLIPATSAPAPEYKFTATTSSYTSSFSFKISAAGTFYVDWGDGNTETIEKPDTTYTTYSHNYSTAGTYTIKIGGLATAYSSSRTAAAVAFVASSDIESVDGSLGAIFPTLSDGSQPSFYRTFSVSNKLTSIPENLFSGVTGAAEGMFESTFEYCSSLTSIPENLFAGITGAAEGMFESTFESCTSLTSIPENLFSGVTGAAEGMFKRTFYGCSSLTGPSARINGKYLYELWPGNVAKWGSSMYGGATGLSDYACIPTDMGGFGNECDTTCPAGEYISSMKCKTCPAGFYCNDTALTYCPYGTYSTGGASTCTTCTTAPCDPTTGATLEYKFIATIDLGLYDDNQMGWGSVTEFGFNLGAAGTFYVDWGDGNTETIKKDNTDAVTYTHDYGTTSGTYTVKISGLATDYSDDEYTPAISFSVDVAGISTYSQAITAIFGSLGTIFPTLSDASQPRFMDLFWRSPIQAIPSGLFDGIHGVPVSNMFMGAFSDCNGLTSIPENLFSGITDTADGMFEYTFQACNMLTGPSARINGKYLYDLWPDNVADWGVDMYTDATGLDDYACIPTVMGGGGEECEPAPEVLCTIGISQIKTSTGLSFALYAEKKTQPSLAIKYNNGICYGKLESGSASSTINFNYNDAVYHLVN